MAPKKPPTTKNDAPGAVVVRPLIYLDLVSVVPVASPAGVASHHGGDVSVGAPGTVTPATTAVSASPQASPASNAHGAAPSTAAAAQQQQQPFGRLVFELAADLCPKTAENFRQLCNGVTVGDKKSQRTVSYKNCRFLRLTKEGLQCGDVLQKDDGKGSESIYGPTFEDEALGAVPHVMGTLSMCNSGPNTNGSQFFVSLTTSPFLDSRHVSFGTLVEGAEVLHAAVKILQGATGPAGFIEKSKSTLLIGACGALERNPPVA